MLNYPNPDLVRLNAQLHRKHHYVFLWPMIHLANCMHNPWKPGQIFSSVRTVLMVALKSKWFTEQNLGWTEKEKEDWELIWQVNSRCIKLEAMSNWGVNYCTDSKDINNTNHPWKRTWAKTFQVFLAVDYPFLLSPTSLEIVSPLSLRLSSPSKIYIRKTNTKAFETETLKNSNNLSYNKQRNTENRRAWLDDRKMREPTSLLSTFNSRGLNKGESPIRITSIFN